MAASLKTDSQPSPKADSDALVLQPATRPLAAQPSASSVSAQSTGVTDPITTVRLDPFGTGVSILLPGMGSRDVGVTIDGRIDEAIWRDVPGYDNMLVMDPDTLVEPRYKTDVRLFYTDKGLYIAAFM